MSPLDSPSSRPSTGYTALRRGRHSERARVYLVTTIARERARVFANPTAARCAAACLVDPRVVGDNRLLAWVLMPDHLHLLLELGGSCSLSVSVGRIKSAIARRVNACLGANGALWECGFHDHALRREDGLAESAQYLAQNPVRAGIVQRVEDYEFWGSVWR